MIHKSVSNISQIGMLILTFIINRLYLLQSPESIPGNDSAYDTVWILSYGYLRHRYMQSL